MPVELYVAPAAAGKTEYCLRLALQAARDLACLPRVCVASAMQVRCVRRRLCEPGGGYLGVRVSTMPVVYLECLHALGEAPTSLGDSARYRLTRHVLDGLPLQHYARLRARPGFVAAVEELLVELEDGLIAAETFRAAVGDAAESAALRELADIYAAYQERLRARGWADRERLGWLALQAVGSRGVPSGAGWSLVIVDGFARLSPLQCRFLSALGEAGTRVVVTLEGVPGDPSTEVEQAARLLGAAPQPLLGPAGHASTDNLRPALAHLRTRAFCGAGEPTADATGAVRLLEAPDRTGEVRAALRWLKARRAEGARPNELALLTPNLDPYRRAVVQVAREFGMSVRLSGGVLLGESPVVAALLDLLRLLLPAPGGSEPGLPRRLVVEAWRSPYVDWSSAPDGEGRPIGILPRHADELDRAARAGCVIGGLPQWEEALSLWDARERPAADDEDDDDGPRQGSVRELLLPLFRHFVARMRPPAAPAGYRDYAGWVDGLIGDLPDSATGEVDGDHVRSLRVAQRCREDQRGAGDIGVAAGGGVADDEAAALKAFKDVLRGLVWAEQALGLPPPDSFAAFFAELSGAVEAMSFEADVPSGSEGIEVADLERAQGVSFRAVALLGLSEGEFPARLMDDPFLPDAVRRALAGPPHGLPLQPVLESTAAAHFRHALARPREALLITRPRLDEDGAAWAASPFWEDVRRLVDVRPEVLVTGEPPEWEAICSWPEWLECAAARGCEPVAPEARVDDSGFFPSAARWLGHLRHASDVFAARYRRRGGPFDGALGHLAPRLSEEFGSEHVWSASRLETYRACPFRFFVECVLGLQPRPDPVEGLDARQLGSVYHRILEHVYRGVPPEQRTDAQALLSALPRVADAVLDAAPAQEGFRPTAWWRHTRAGIVADVERSITTLAALPGDYAPWRLEERFYEPRELRLDVDGVVLRVHGLIDRVDRAADGRLRVIDYKTAGRSAYTSQAILRGEKLQLPLYALAARDALGLGEPAEGFYWHVRDGEPSGFTLSGVDGGPEEAFQAALSAVSEAVRGVHGGQLTPTPPTGGCPPYCGAAAFCWWCREGWR